MVRCDFRLRAIILLDNDLHAQARAVWMWCVILLQALAFLARSHFGANIVNFALLFYSVRCVILLHILMFPSATRSGTPG